jgi:pimeloyl-ACP methyl ester carboxylesterase
MEHVILQHHGAAVTPSRRMLLLHGLANSSAVWTPLLARRPDWLECVTADLPWRADGPPGWSHDPDPVGWVAQALGAVPGGAGVVLAHSFSANLLLQLLSTELERGRDPFRHYGIDGLVLVAPFYRRAPEHFDTSLLDDPRAGFRGIMAEGVRLRSRRPLDPVRESELAERVCERVGPYGWIRFYETYLRTPWLRVGAIPVPVLVATGARDGACHESAALAADLPLGFLDIAPDSGHFPMSTQPDRFVRVLTRFCVQLTTSTATPTPAGV